jgi:hypothetical protein
MARTDSPRRCPSTCSTSVTADTKPRSGCEPSATPGTREAECIRFWSKPGTRAVIRALLPARCGCRNKGDDGVRPSYRSAIGFAHGERTGRIIEAESSRPDRDRPHSSIQGHDTVLDWLDQLLQAAAPLGTRCRSATKIAEQNSRRRRRCACEKMGTGTLGLVAQARSPCYEFDAEPSIRGLVCRTGRSG